MQKILLNVVRGGPATVLYTAIVLSVALLGFEMINFKQLQSPHASIVLNLADGSRNLDLEQIVSKVLPEKTVLRPRWQGIPYRLVEANIVNLEQLKAYSAKFGQTVTADDLKIFQKDYNGPIEYSRQGSLLIDNLLWAIGFTNKSPVLEYEIEKYGNTVKNLAGYYFSFANLGANSTLPNAGYNYLELTPLTEEQKKVVLTVAGNSAVPSCGNSLLLPDCSCSFAMVGLINMMTQQGFNEQEIYRAMKAVYPYRFPGIYVQYATLYQLAKQQEWEKVDPQELVSFERSSSRGVHKMRRELQAILGDREITKVESH